MTDALASDTEALLLEMTPRLRGLARILMGSDADAEDVVQATFVQFLSKGPPSDGQHAPMWMLKTARNLALNRLRTDRRRTARDQAHPTPADATDPAETASLRESSARIRTCLEQLPLEYREPLYLKVVEGLSLREIAVELAQGKSTVASRVETGLVLLNRCFHGGGHAT